LCGVAEHYGAIFTRREGARDEAALIVRVARAAWVAFKRDPRASTLEARVLGYEKP
jgi:hypothetical protein